MPRIAAVAALVVLGGASTFIAGSALHGRGDRARVPLVYRAARGHENELSLRRSGRLLQLYDATSARVVREQTLARTSRVVVYGRSGPTDDTLTVDFRRGRFALPGGVRFDGGRGGFDSLAVRGGRFDRAVNDPAIGSIFVPGLAIRYANLEPTTDTIAAGTYTVNGTDGPDTITLDNGTANNDGLLRVTVNGGEPVQFSNKTNVVINGD